MRTHPRRREFNRKGTAMTNIAVLVSGGGTNLQALIDASRAGRLPSGRLAVVVSSKPDVRALERAAAAGIPAHVVKRADHPDETEFSRLIMGILEEYDVGLVVLAGFLSVLSNEFLDRYKNRVINVHPALLPSFCGKGFYGLRPHEAALERGVKLSGATVHFVNGEVDGGPIILQRAVPVLEDDTPQTLQARVMAEAERPLLAEAAELICAGRVTVNGNKVRIS